LYTGTGSAQTITNGIDLANDGGLVWIKSRTENQYTYSHTLQDTERGTTKFLQTNNVSGELTATDRLTSFNSNGFSLGTNINVNNGNPENYVSWTFKKQTKFFDIVTYTGNGTAGRTVSHNLGSVPGMIIVKKTSDTDFWTVYHRGTDATSPEDYWLNLSGTGAASSAANMWNGTAPTNTEFTVSAQSNLNGNGSTYVAYIFAHDTAADSIINCGSYTGNGSTTGPTVNLGWEPQWLLYRNAEVTANWRIIDNMRGWGVQDRDGLFANSNSPEDTTDGDRVEVTSTGFKITTTNSQINGNNQNHIYMAIRSASDLDITWPSSIEFAGGIAPAAPATGETDIFTFSTDDGGTSYIGTKTADNLS